MGKTDRGVKPGIVFNSLMMILPSSVKKKSTLASPSHPRAEKAVTAADLILSVSESGRLAGVSKLVEPSRYFASKL